MRRDGRARVFAMILAALTGASLATAPTQAADLRKVNASFTVQDCGTPLKVLRLIAATCYRHPDTGKTHLFLEYGTNNGYGIGSHEWEDTSHSLIDVNLESGEIRRAKSGKLGGITTSHFFHPDGNMYLFEVKTNPSSLARYDPRTNTYEKIATAHNQSYKTLLAPNGRIYMGEVGGYVSVFDPAANRYTIFRQPSGRNTFWGVYTMEVEEPWVYCGIANRGRWFLTVINVETGRTENFFDTERGQPAPAGKGNGVRRTEKGNIFFGQYLVKDGKPQMDAEGKPAPLPEPDKSPTLAGNRPWPNMWRVSGYANKPYDEAEKGLGLAFDLENAEPNNWNGGIATIRWRQKDADGWKQVHIKGLPLVPNSPKSLAVGPEGKFVGVGNFYGDVFEFDPETGESRKIGDPPGSVYCMLRLKDRTFFAGYVNFMAEWVHDRPYCIGRSADWKDDVNPKRYRAGAKAVQYIIEGPDNRIYMGGRFGRHHPGGGVGIFDPKTKEMELLRSPWFDYLAVQGLYLVNDGKHVAILTYPLGLGRPETPEKGSIFLYDVAQRKIAEQITLGFKVNPDELFVAGDGTPIGVSRFTQEDEYGNRSYETLIYGLDLSTGEPTFERRFKGQPFTGICPYWDTPLTRGPDGCGWLFVDEDLCRVRPDGELERIGPCKWRGKMIWQGDTLYLYNGGRVYVRLFANIVRIRDLFKD